MLAALPDIDPRAADARRAQADHLAGPLQAGFEVERLALDDAGAATIAAGLDSASLFARLLTDLADEELRVTVGLTDAGGSSQVDLVFESRSQAGTALLIRRRGTAAGALAVAVTATRGGGAVPAAALVELDLLAGNMGHLATVLAFEQQRIRRHLSAVAAARTIAGARAATLDRIGSDLGVRRFDNAVVFTGAGVELHASPEDVETDISYRRRLALYRPHLFPTRDEVLARLRAIHPAFDLDERDNPYEAAFRLVAVAGSDAEARALRAAALGRLRRTQLLGLDAGTLPRPIPSREQAAERELAQRLRAGLAAVPAGAALAPNLARALDRLLGLAAAVGYAGPISLLQAQTDDGGSLYELGLGARLGMPATFVTDLAAAVAAADPAGAGAYHAVVEALQKRGASALDSLLEPLGFTTARQLDAAEIYVSHLELGSTEIAGPAVLFPLGDPATGDYTFQDLAPRTEAELAQALQDAAARAALTGAAVTGVQALAMLPTLPALDPATRPPLLANRFGLADQTAFAGRLVSTDPATLAGLVLSGAAAQRLRDGDAAAWGEVATLAFALADDGVPAMAALVRETGDVVLLASSVGLPVLGPNLTLRQSVATRWVATPVGQVGNAQGLSANGRSFRFQTGQNGLWCIGLVTYRREGRTDPLEVRPSLPPGVLIDYLDYERMMNVLQLACPAGIEINTWRIRQRHVRLDPAAPAAPLDVSAARSFRRYRQGRFAMPGAAIAGDDDG